jgi:hypothetical protein
MANELRNFDWRVPLVVPTFIEGADAPVLHTMFEKDVKERLNGNSAVDVLSLVQNEGSIPYVSGSNVFASVEIDNLVRDQGLRVFNLQDLGRPEVLAMLKGRYYSDIPTLVAQSHKDSYEKNQKLLDKVVELAEKHSGKVEFPFMVSGFNVINTEDCAYNLGIAPRDDFTVVQDRRLAGNSSGNNRFSEVDELGLMKWDKNGNRTYFARDNGLSGLYVGSSLYLGASSGNLGDSYGLGRVGLVSGEATSAEFLKQYATRQKANFKELKADLDKKYGENEAKINALRKELDL